MDQQSFHADESGGGGSALHALPSGKTRQQVSASSRLGQYFDYSLECDWSATDHRLGDSKLMIVRGTVYLFSNQPKTAKRRVVR
jgi:hypothetical protein